MRCSECKTPRIDDAVALVVTYVNELPVPPGGRDGDREQARLTTLRDRALLRTLWATGMRREELSRLNRTDIQDGRDAEGLITGKGDMDRVVSFDDGSLEAIRMYLDARGGFYLPLTIGCCRRRKRRHVPASLHARRIPGVRERTGHLVQARGTAKAGEEDRENAIRHGCIGKPFDLDKLVETIEELTHSHAHSPAA